MTIFFLNATRSNCLVLKSIWEEYCTASGQKINLDKSCVFVSSRASEEVRNTICENLGISRADSPGKYLGLPVLWGRSKVEALAFVRDRVRKKVLG